MPIGMTVEIPGMTADIYQQVMANMNWGEGEGPQAQGFIAIAMMFGAVAGLLAQWGIIRMFEMTPRQLIDRYSTREVTELRFPAGVQETLNGQLDGLAERVERLADRVLLYADDGEAVAVAAHERGLQPETVLVRRSTLEDVFLRLTGRSLIE